MRKGVDACLFQGREEVKERGDGRDISRIHPREAQRALSSMAPTFLDRDSETKLSAWSLKFERSLVITDDI